jgi:hypothetical protein
MADEMKWYMCTYTGETADDTEISFIPECFVTEALMERYDAGDDESVQEMIEKMINMPFPAIAHLDTALFANITYEDAKQLKPPRTIVGVLVFQRDY